MVYEIIRYRIEPERVDAFLRACAAVDMSLLRSGHCLEYQLSRCSQAPEDFVLLIAWDSPEISLRQFHASRELEPFRPSVQPFSEEIWDCANYERVSLRAA